MFGNYRTQEEVGRMTVEAMRNTLIVELAWTSSHSIAELQGFPTTGTWKSLVGLAYISSFLKSRGIRSKKQLAGMSYGDQRNTLIVFLYYRTNYGVPYLQSLGDFQLVQIGFQV